MTGESVPVTDELLERLSRGDIEAAKELTGRFYDRLVRIASVIYHKSFPSLNGRHDLESLLNQAWIRLMKALETERPGTVEKLFDLAVLMLRRVMLDVIKKQRRDDARRVTKARGSERSSVAAYEPAGSTLDPARLALWTEFQEKLATLPADEHRVFLLHGFGDYTQARIAEMMGLHPSKVSRLWLAASAKLADSLEAIKDRT